jgi:hypothetical protein
LNVEAESEANVMSPDSNAAASANGSGTSKCCSDRRCCVDGNPQTCDEMAAELRAFLRGEITAEQISSYTPAWAQRSALQADLLDDVF